MTAAHRAVDDVRYVAAPAGAYACDARERVRACARATRSAHSRAPVIICVVQHAGHARHRPRPTHCCGMATTSSLLAACHVYTVRAESSAWQTPKQRH